MSGKTEWIWRVAPGPHDYGDCMAMAYACAAFAGIGTGGVSIGGTGITQFDLLAGLIITL